MIMIELIKIRARQILHIVAFLKRSINNNIIEGQILYIDAFLKISNNSVAFLKRSNNNIM